MGIEPYFATVLLVAAAIVAHRRTSASANPDGFQPLCELGSASTPTLASPWPSSGPSGSSSASGVSCC